MNDAANTSTDPSDSGGSTGMPIGRRVVVRYLIEDGARATDVLGILVAQDEVGLDIETKHGVVRVPRGSVVAAKLVPPAPTRRRHRRRSD